MSLLEIMERCHPEIFVHLARILQVFHLPEVAEPGVVRVSMQPINDHNRERLRQWLTNIEHDCAALGLTTSVITIRRAVNILSQPAPNMAHLDDIAKELEGRLIDEMSGTLFLHIDLRQAQYYQTPLNNWDLVAEKFPSASIDIEEASKCYALARNTACVFHCMRVLEIGLNALAGELGVSYDTANWQFMIDKIQKQIREIGPVKGPDWKEKEHFYSEAAIEFKYFKDAWRNHVMHVRANFDDERANRILEHVKGFMLHLCTKLSERSS